MQVIFGATGNTGGHAARTLIDRGEALRVVVRHAEQGEAWAALGAEVAVAEMDDPDAAAAALAGAEGAYFLSPPPHEADPFATVERIGASYAEAARRAGLPKAVVLSSFGAQHPDGNGIIATLHRLEQLLQTAAPAVTLLRCGYFAENWGQEMPAVIHEGVLPTLLPPDLPVPSVSTADVGRAVADLLFEEWNGVRVIELTADRDWTAGEAAGVLSDLLGRSVAPAYVPLDQQVEILGQAGVPGEIARLLVGMHEGIIEGRIGREAGVEQRIGTVSLESAVAGLLKAHAEAA